MKLIINADDCGRSTIIDEHIDKALADRKITSTTVMANMDDLDGAVALFKKYRDSASFGFHINLTQGSPLLHSQKLLEIGFYKQVDGHIEFNAQSFRRKFLNATLRNEIYKEVLAQYNRIKETGIEISHIDSHHFIHQSLFMIPIVPKLCKETGIYKVRNYRNYMPLTVSRITRSLWSALLKLQEPKLKFTTFFTSYEGFYNAICQGKLYYLKDDTIELMCHPGGQYISEEELLLNTEPDRFFKADLINYKDL